jgi:class 3 adenylate cyclase/tetratricopeptide (TPR) repeat protein
MANLQHRLAALWFADIVGFSQLSHEDESSALEVVQLFQGIARDTVDRYGGHVVKFVGDGALAEFHSTEAAIRAACRLRSSFSEQSKANDLGERDLRVGVHVGEIATTPDGDVYGDGVNATARIMNQAEPGQVLATEDVWHQLRQRKEFQFEALGEHDLRGAGQLVLHSVHVEDETSTEWPEVRQEAPASRLGTLYDELKRRRVFRVAAAYAIVAWLVTQIATTVVPELFLPAWITRAVIVFAILGFPIAMVLAWAYDITREGLKRTLPAGADSDLRAHGLPLVQKVAAGLVIAAVVVGGWAGWNRWSLGPPSISASTVAILPFNVRGGEALDYLSDGMVSLIATKMGGVEQYNSVDPRVVINFVERRGLRNIDRQSGQTVAERYGAGLYVMGDVVELGDQLHLNVSIYELGKEEPTAQISVQGDADNLTGLVDQIVGLMLAAQFGKTEARLRSLAAMTTDSLEALKAYLEGEQELNSGRFLGAVDAFQRAVEIDNHFALAYYKLAMSAAWIPDFDLQKQAVENAVTHSSRLSPQHLVLVQAFHAHQTSNPTKVDSLLRRYLAIHPDDVEALYIYGDARFHFNQLFGRPIGQSREPFERALELAPNNDYLTIHLMEAAASEGGFDTVDSLLQRVDPGSDIELEWQTLLAFAIGTESDQNEVIEALKSSSDDQLRSAMVYLSLYSPLGRGTELVADLFFEPGRPPLLNRSGHLWLIQLYLRDGRWDTFEKGIDALRPFDADRALKFHALYATLPFLAVPDAELTALRTAVAQWDPAGGATDTNPDTLPAGFNPIYREYLIGLLSVSLGEERTVREQIQRLSGWQGQTAQANVGRFLARHLEAHLARRSGRTAEALELLSATAVDLPGLPPSERAFSPFIWHSYERYIRAELLFEQGRLEEALEWYGVLTEGANWLNVIYAPMSHYRLGQIYEQLGEPDEAIEHYSTFIHFWQQCDPALRPMVDDAESRLQQLAPQIFD